MGQPLAAVSVVLSGQLVRMKTEQRSGSTVEVSALTRAEEARGWCRGGGSGAQCSVLPSLHHTHGRGRANDGIEQWAFTKVWCGAALTRHLLVVDAEAGDGSL